MYKLVYDKRYGSAFRNPWSEEELANKGVAIIHRNKDLPCMWIKSEPYAYCFLNNFDQVDSILNEKSAQEAFDYLESNYDRKENIKEVVNKYL